MENKEIQEIERDIIDAEFEPVNSVKDEGPDIIGQHQNIKKPCACDNKDNKDVKDIQCKKQNHKHFSDVVVNKAEGFLMFIVTVAIMCVGFLMLQSLISAQFDEIKTKLNHMEQKIAVLETKLDTYLDYEYDKPINITLNIDDMLKDYEYNQSTGETTEQPSTDDTLIEEFDTSPFLGVGFNEENVGGNPIGLRIDYVYQYSPAEFAGIKAGDVIMAIDGEKISTFDDLSSVISRHKANDTIEIDLATTSETGINFVTVAAQLTYRGNFDFGTEE